MSADPSLLAKALAEAYASAPKGQIPLDTLELNHPNFTQPIRVVRWPVTGPAPRIFDLCLEDDAPINPGAVVQFIGFPFDLKIPESSNETEGTFELRLSVHQEIDQVLMAAVLNPGIITAIYRQYVTGLELEGPSAVWPDIEIQSPRREGGDIVAQGAILRWMFKNYRDLYTAGKFLGITAGR
jgi:hypothetical protein